MNLQQVEVISLGYCFEIDGKHILGEKSCFGLLSTVLTHPLLLQNKLG